MTTDFSSETTRTRRQGHGILLALKEKNCETRILYPANIYFRNKGQTKKISGERKLRECIARRRVPDVIGHVQGGMAVDRTCIPVFQTKGK